MSDVSEESPTCPDAISSYTKSSTDSRPVKFPRETPTCRPIPPSPNVSNFSTVYVPASEYVASHPVKKSGG